MSNRAYQKLADIITEKSGINLRPRDFGRLERILKRRRKKLKAKDLDDYIKYIEKEGAISELNILTEEITIPETYFFRDINQCRALEEYILPELIRRKKDKRIRIWSAGCSTGEEAYTIGIILSKKMADLRTWNIEVIGTDISREGIKKAAKGVYTKNSFRGVEQDIIDEFFVRSPNGMVINDDIRGMVQFEIFNIKLDNGLLFPHKYSGFDVVFCRNVLIYFKKATAEMVVRALTNSLGPGGYLVLGHSESAFVPKEIITPIRTNDTFIYQRRATEKQNPKPVKQIQNERVLSKEKPVLLPEQKSAPKTNIPPEPADLYQKALLLYMDKKYNEAQTELAGLMPHSYVDTDALVLLSLVQMNMGDLTGAASTVKKARKSDEFSPDIHFLMGLIHEAGAEHENAIKEHQAALFLDNGFFFSHFRLGQVFNRVNMIEDSRRSFRNALETIGSQDEEKIRLYSGGFSTKILEDICKKGMG